VQYVIDDAHLGEKIFSFAWQDDKIYPYNSTTCAPDHNSYSTVKRKTHLLLTHSPLSEVSEAAISMWLETRRAQE